jgi:hypothetical protein
MYHCTISVVSGTAAARVPQIRSKMLSWNGARLGEGYPSAFGELLDYARHLGFDEPIDYDALPYRFRKSTPLGSKDQA